MKNAILFNKEDSSGMKEKFFCWVEDNQNIYLFNKISVYAFITRGKKNLE